MVDQGAIFIETTREDPNKSYCLCRRKYNPGENMLACDYCPEWFHFGCIGFKGEEADASKVDPFYCPFCALHLNKIDEFYQLHNVWFENTYKDLLQKFYDTNIPNIRNSKKIKKYLTKIRSSDFFVQNFKENDSMHIGEKRELGNKSQSKSKSKSIEKNENIIMEIENKETLEAIQEKDEKDEKVEKEEIDENEENVLNKKKEKEDIDEEKIEKSNLEDFMECELEVQEKKFEDENNIANILNKPYTGKDNEPKGVNAFEVLQENAKNQMKKNRKKNKSSKKTNKKSKKSKK